MDQLYLNQCHDNLNFNLKIICDIVPDDNLTSQAINVSDSNGWVDDIFYEARLKIPKIKRSLGLYLKPNIQFPDLTLEINNADGQLNKFLPGGEHAGALHTAKVKVFIGNGEVKSSYKTLFSGQVKKDGGIKRSTSSLIITVRDGSDILNKPFPQEIFNKSTYPHLEDSIANKIIPYIFGDFTKWSDHPIVPAYPVNALQIADQPLHLVICKNHVDYIDIDKICLVRGSTKLYFSSGDIQVGPFKNDLYISQNGSTTIPDSNNGEGSYKYSSGDNFLVSIRVGSGDPVDICSNIIELSDIMIAKDTDSWQKYYNTSGLIRISLDQTKTYLEYLLSILESVRLEAFFNRHGLFEISSIRLQDAGQITQYLTQFDFEQNSISPEESDKLINKLIVRYDRRPDKKETTKLSNAYINVKSLKVRGEIPAALDLPYTYRDQDAVNEGNEHLKMSGSGREYIRANLSMRSLLLDLGEWVMVTLEEGSVIYQDVPMRVVEIGFNNYKIPVKLCSYQMCPFPGYNPDHPVYGGHLAVISEVESD